MVPGVRVKLEWSKLGCPAGNPLSDRKNVAKYWRRFAWSSAKTHHFTESLAFPPALKRETSFFILGFAAKNSSRYFPTMKISDLLCSPLEAQPAPVSFQPRGEEENDGRAKFKKTIQLRAVKKSAQLAVLPDKRRKRHYLSVAQKQRRREYEAFESRVFNLTLDINQLKQEVKRLQECRDLYTTRLLLNRQRWENDVLGIVEALICGARMNLCGNVVRPQVCKLARTITTEPSSQTAVVACGSVHEFNIHLEKARFLCVISSMQVVFGGEDEDSEVVGGSGECVVEVVANITFPFSRHLLTAVFPHAVCDEFLIARLVGVTITCPVRMFLHFNAQRELGRQVGQVEMLPALQQVRPNEIAALASDQM